MDAVLEIAGRKLGDFVVREQIGEGGFGVVHRAEQPLLGREAVVKLLHTRYRASPVLIQRFLREARLASRLDHPYAAHIYAFGVEPDGLMWIAMERVQGTPLNRLLASKGPLPLVELVPLVERIAEVIQAAHEQGIVHRDIKPGNVMVIARAGKLLPKLLDFGIAKAIADAAPEELGGPNGDTPGARSAATDDTIEFVRNRTTSQPPVEGAVVLTQLGQVMGSPPYMAPETWRDLASADARADLYAFGILAYEALAGRRPFMEKSLPALGLAHTLTPVPPLGDQFPPALDDVFRKILAKEPADRYADAVSFAAAFRSAAGLGTHAEELPRLDEALRRRLLAGPPQPIAEAVVELDAARNAHQARDALAAVVSTITRVLSLIAIACRARTGPGGAADEAEVSNLIRELRRHGLSDRERIDLVRSLIAPFIGRRELHPIPALVELFAPGCDPFGELVTDSSPRDPAVRGGEAQALEALHRGLPALARLLEAIAFLDDTPLVVGRDGRAELWMGVRRSHRRAVAVSPEPEDGQVSLIDAAGQVVVMLSPLFQCAPPAPGAAPELFLLEGPGRQGARLTAHPARFDRYDGAPWDWLADTLLVADDASQTLEERAPYRGLASFTTEDAELFVGRSREIEAVVNRLRTQALIAIVGPSGAGKSSLVQAGVVPALPPRWRAITVRPGAEPMRALDARLAREQIDPGAIADGEVLVVVVDQLEELFTQCPDPDERFRYVDRLSRLARSPDDPVRVVFTLRDDFLVRANELSPLRERLATGMLLLSTPAPDELERLLVEPAHRAGYDFDDPTLPRRIVAEVADLPGALPLLSFTASRMWELRDRHFHRLTAQVYDALGGVAGALAQHAEQTLAELGGEQQRLVREVFRNLVTADGTRAALGREQIAQLVGVRGGLVVETLISARLLVATEGEGGQERIEIVHESLLTAWPRLVEWRREDAEGARLRDQLRVAARQWVDRDRASGLLWRDDALAEYRAWRSRWPARLTDDEEAFARASLAEATRARRLRRGAIATALLVLGSAVVVLAYLGQRAQTERNKAEVAQRSETRARKHVEDQARKEHDRVVAQFVDNGRSALLEGDAARALVWLQEARKLGSQDRALPIMLGLATRPVAAQIRVLKGHTEQIRSLDVTSDGRLAVTAGQDGTARVWELATGRATVLAGAGDALEVAAFDPAGARVLTAGADGRVRVYAIDGELQATLEGPGGGLFFAEWSPDGEHIAAAGVTSEAWVWDIATGKRLHRLAHRAPIGAIAMSRDGTLACATYDGGVSLWDIRSGKKRGSLIGHRDGIRTAAFSADGRRLATTSLDGATIVWDVAARKIAIPPFHGHNGWVERQAFSPDGKWLVTVSADRTGRVWSMADGSSRCLLEGHSGAVYSVAFDRSGRRIVTAGADGIAIVWDTATCAQITTLQGHSGPVRSARFAADDDVVITASLDRTARLWTTTGGALEAILTGHTQRVGVARYSSDGSQIYTFSNDGTIRLWDRSGAALATLVGHAGPVNRIAWTRDGRHLASAGDDGSVRIWDAQRAALVHSLPAHEGPALQVAFSPDGRRVISAGRDGILRTWDLATGAVANTIRAHDDHVNVLGFSPDGTRVVSADWAGVTKLWDTSGGLLGTLSARGGVNDAAFSPDGSVVATGSTDSRARLWNVANGGVLELRHGGVVFSVRFDPAGERLVTAAEDGVVRIWHAQTGESLGLLEGHAGKVYSAAFSSAGDLVVSAGSDRTVRVWDAQTGREIARFIGHQLGVSGAEFDPAGTHVVSTGLDWTVMVWSIAPAARSFTETDRLLRCVVPFEVRRDRLEPRRPDPAGCAPD